MRRYYSTVIVAGLVLTLPACTLAPAWSTALGRTADGDLVGIIMRCPDADPVGLVTLIDGDAYDVVDGEDSELAAATIATWPEVDPDAGETVQFPISDLDLDDGVNYHIGTDTFDPWNIFGSYDTAEIAALEPGTMLDSDDNTVPLGPPPGC